MKRSTAPAPRMFYTTHDIARLTGVDPSTVHKWLGSGLLRFAKTPGGHRRILAEDLKRFLASLGHKMPRELGPLRHRVLLLGDNPASVAKTAGALKRAQPGFELYTRDSGLGGVLDLPELGAQVVVVDGETRQFDAIALARAVKARPATASMHVVVVGGPQDKLDDGVSVVPRDIRPPDFIALLWRLLEPDRIVEA